MAKTRIKCPKCDRTFSMAAHLARHMNTIHVSPAKRKAKAKALAKKRGKRVQSKKGAKRAKPKAKRKVAKRVARVGRPAGRTGDGGVRVLKEMRAYHADLMAQRSSLDDQIGAIEAAMGAMGGTAAPRRRRPGPRPGARGRAAGRPRAGRAGSLKDAIVSTLRQYRKAMSPKDLSAAVVKGGYKTKAKDLTKAISNVLPQVKGVKKVGRGMYRT